MTTTLINLHHFCETMPKQPISEFPETQNYAQTLFLNPTDNGTIQHIYIIVHSCTSVALLISVTVSNAFLKTVIYFADGNPCMVSRGNSTGLNNAQGP